MKRAREEEGELEQDQEQEQAAPAPMVASPARNPTSRGRAITWDDIVDFMLSVKRTFDGAKYLEFLNIVRQVDSIGVSGIVHRLKVLFRGHPDLKSSFNSMFLPEQYDLSLTDDD